MCLCDGNIGEICACVFDWSNDELVSVHHAAASSSGGELLKPESSYQKFQSYRETQEVE